VGITVFFPSFLPFVTSPENDSSNAHGVVQLAKSNSINLF